MFIDDDANVGPLWKKARGGGVKNMFYNTFLDLHQKRRERERLFWQSHMPVSVILTAKLGGREKEERVCQYIKLHADDTDTTDDR